MLTQRSHTSGQTAGSRANRALYSGIAYTRFGIRIADCKFWIYNCPMHIGIDARLPYYQMGGISQYTIFLIQALAALDNQNQYTIFQHRRDSHFHTPNSQNFKRKDLWTPCHHRLERWSVAVELLPHRLDVMHCTDFIPPVIGAKRWIITVHDLNFLYYPQFLTAASRRFYNDQIEWAVRHADHIIVPSEATRKDTLALLSVPPEKVTTIPLGGNPLYDKEFSETVVAATLTEYKLPRGFILAVGTLEPRKNYPMLIQAYARLRQKGVDVPLVLVGGKGWLYDEIFTQIAALGLKKCVRHLSGVSDEKLAHLYRGAGVLVTPSHYEGFGLPALEAQKSGCPVIVSSRASLPEIVGPQGMTLDPDDVDAWVDGVEWVLTDVNLRETMTVYGLEQAKMFTWEKAAALTQNLYEGTI